MITYLVNCKINLGLHVVRKRPDGYHDLETVFVPTDFFTDTLSIEPYNGDYEFECLGHFDAGPDDDNLCVRAYRLLQERFGISGVRIVLEKGIPTGAGLGGGSADAAFTLKGLASHFQLDIPAPEMLGLASQLGSDVPFFILNTPAYATGRGEVLTPIKASLSDYEIRIVKPDVSVSTREAYAGIQPHESSIRLDDVICNMPVSEWRNCIHNDFEMPVFAKHPELAKIKQDFYEQGALYAAMSGSGSAMFGIFPKES